MATGSVPISAGTGTPIRIVNNAGVDAGADQQVVSLADSAGNLLGTASAPVPVGQVLTKGTQGAFGVTSQDLKDSGRTAIVLSATAITSATAVALFTFNIWKAGVVSSAAQYQVTAGKTFRIQGIQFGARFATPSTTVTFATARFDIRTLTASGTLAVTSPLLYGDTKMAAANAATPNSDLAIPDGLELPSGFVIGASHVDSAATLLLDVLIVGYEY